MNRLEQLLQEQLLGVNYGRNTQLNRLTQAAQRPINALTDTRRIAYQDPSFVAAQRSVGSSPVGVALPNNPYRAEAEQRVLDNINRGLSDPMVVGAIKAYHGTPHTFAPEPGAPFGRFKKEAIGTGEGAAAYGHGASYSAESREVADQYRKNLTADSMPEIGGVPMNRIRGLDKYAISGLALDPEDVPKTTLRGAGARKLMLQRAKRWLTPQDYDQFLDAILPYHAAELSYPGRDRTGHILELSHEWPDKAREAVEPLSRNHLLDWYKPMSEQSEYVKQKLSGVTLADASPINFDMGGGSFIRDNRRGQFDPSRSDPWLLDTGTAVFGLSQKDVDRMTKVGANASGESIYGALVGAKGSQRAASEYLNSIGIPGIAYLDQGSRAGGRGTSNYVIFEPEYTKILARD